MAWAAEEALRCSGCGHTIDESMDVKNQGLYDAKAWVCHACAARDAAAQDWNGSTHGLRWMVTK